MALSSLIRQLFRKPQPQKKQDMVWIPPVGCGEIVPVEATQEERQTDGGPETDRLRDSQGYLMLRLTKEPGKEYGSTTRFVDWIGSEDNTKDSRLPHPRTYKYSLLAGFRIGEMEYRSISELREKVLNKERQIYWDIYGRVFAEIKERFPCFDFYDFESEYRYYHWLYLTENGKLYCAYYEDEGAYITVTEDVGAIEGILWEKLVRLGWVKEVETQVLIGFLGAPGAKEL